MSDVSEFVSALSSEEPTQAMSTFIFADLAGYTALTEAHGDESAADVAAQFCEDVRSLLNEYSAEEIKTIGDALLLRVPKAGPAVHLAARLASELGVGHRSLGVRVGMHTGTAVRRGEDWFGGAVNLASRVADVARAGEVLLTESTEQAARGSVDPSQVHPRGPRRFKNVGEPVEVFALVLDGGSTDRLPIDPVCRMAIDPEQAQERSVYGGVEYHFCSAACAHAFSSDPRRYIRRRSSREVIRVSDQARERAVARLASAYGKGRIDQEQLEERTERAWSAQTRGDLHAVSHDLRRRRRSWIRAMFRRLRRRLPGRLGGARKRPR